MAPREVSRKKQGGEGKQDVVLSFLTLLFFRTPPPPPSLLLFHATLLLLSCNFIDYSQSMWMWGNGLSAEWVYYFPKVIEMLQDREAREEYHLSP